MSMVTTCPHCATSFNVEAEVLLLRDGRVRCGHCKQIFDGLLSATSREEFEAAVPGAATAVPEGVAPPPAASAALPEAFETYWPALPDVPEVPVPPMPLEIAAAASGDNFDTAAAPDAAPDAALSPLPAPEPITHLAPTTQTAHASRDAEPEQATLDAAQGSESKRMHRGWAVAATLAALLLAGQVTYRYRSELAAHVPVVKPALAQACAWAGCRVPPLQQPASLNIEASDLQVVDKTRPHLVQLTATLRNRADIDVGYPAFDLVLTDNREHALARRVIAPKDYLSGGAANTAQAFIAANAEVTVRVDMDVSSLPAAGFRLNLTSASSH